MMTTKTFTILIATAVISVSAYAGPKEVYVGDGRYVCEGASSECAATNRRNEGGKPCAARNTTGANSLKRCVSKPRFFARSRRARNRSARAGACGMSKKAK